MSLTKGDKEYLSERFKNVEDKFDNYTTQHAKDHQDLKAEVETATVGAKNWLVTKDRAKWIILTAILLLGGGGYLSWDSILKLINRGG